MTLSLLLSLMVAEGVWGAGWYSYGHPSGLIWKDQLFVAITGRSNSAVGLLYRGRFAPHRPKMLSPVEYANSFGLFHHSLAKLDIGHDRLLLFCSGNNPCICPLVELPFLEYSQFGRELSSLRYDDPTQTYLADKYTGKSQLLLFPSHRKSDVAVPLTPVDPFTANSPERTQWQRESDYTRQARFDVQIAGPTSVRLFHAHGGKIFISVELAYLNSWYWDKNKKVIAPPPEPPNRELRTGDLPAEFTGRFAAYGAGGRDYFLTSTGKVFMVVPKGKTGVEVTPLWNDPKRLIAGVVKDQENDAVYGWGFADEFPSPNRFYVKLEPKPVAKTYKLTVPLGNERDDAYLETYECARVFRNAAEKE